MPKKVAIITLGCAKNSVDTSYMRASIEDGGGVVVGDAAEADVVIVNTCGFIEPAKRESIEVMLAAATLKDEGRPVRLVATGCLVTRYGPELASELPEIDLFIDLAGERDIWSYIEKTVSGFQKGISARRLEPAKRSIDDAPYAYLMIADGCNNRCSYCAIPAIRGPYRSRPAEDIVREAEELSAGGVKELCLVAQDTSAYGLDSYGERRLPELLYKLSEIDEIEWLRLLYVQPQHLTDNLMEAMADIDKVCPYLDLPLQHASDRIIVSMRRWGSRRKYLDLIDRLRDRLPSLALRTSVILGYPGETDEDFRSLTEFVREADFDYLGIFDFSPEEGTEAASLPGRIEPEVASERNRELSALRDDMMQRNASAKIGKKADILIEAVEDGNIIGRAVWQAPEVDGNVYLNGRAEIGSILEVTITAADGCDYEAESSGRAGE
ncbi:MAG: 30S ribosomal protein S12 methylthiotransferase RimO [Actinobacteria bacterium]|nr:30S ribosomal protein S12 methylthiotransferase RimO [Actinomycetota bacterium]